MLNVYAERLCWTLMLNVYVERNACQYRDFKNERNEWSSNGAERSEVNVLKSRTGIYY